MAGYVVCPINIFSYKFHQLFNLKFWHSGGLVPLCWEHRQRGLSSLLVHRIITLIVIWLHLWRTLIHVIHQPR